MTEDYVSSISQCDVCVRAWLSLMFHSLLLRLSMRLLELWSCPLSFSTAPATLVMVASDDVGQCVGVRLGGEDRRRRNDNNYPVKTCKKIHLTLADGSKVRALLHNNLIYTHMAERPLVSEGQLKAMLDIRLMWDNAYPLLLFCSVGKKHVLLKAKVVHQLPIITTQKLVVRLSAIHARASFGIRKNGRVTRAEILISPLALLLRHFLQCSMTMTMDKRMGLEDQPIPLSSISLPSGPQSEAYDLQDSDAKTEPEEEEGTGEWTGRQEEGHDDHHRWNRTRSYP